MPRNFPTTILERFSTPEWVARCYSEYMLDCAAAQAELLGKVTELCSDDSLQNSADQILDGFYDARDSVYSQVRQEIISLGVEDPQDLEPASIRFQVCMLEMCNSNEDFNDEVIDLINKVSDNPIPSQSTIELLCTCDEKVVLDHHGQFNNALSAKVTAMCSALNINPQSVYTLDNGFITYGELFSELAKLCVSDADSGTFSLKDAAGQLINSAKLSYDNVVEQMKSAYASAAAWGTGFAAIAESNISDAMSKFEANIKTLVSDASAKFANTVSTVRAFVSNSIGDIKGFFDQAKEFLGFQQMIDDTFEKVDATDVYAYTGSSPLSALNVKGVQGVLATTGKIVGAVAVGIFKGATKLLGWLWKKAKPFVMAITNNPVDIGVSDKDDDSYACSNFKCQIKQANCYIPFPDLAYPGIAELCTWINNHIIDKWISFESFFGQLTFKIDRVYPSDTFDGSILMEYSAQYRPRCINYRRALQCGVAYVTDNGMTSESIGSLDVNDSLTPWIDFLAGDIRPEDDEDEEYVFMGFWLSSILQEALGGKAYDEVRTWFASEYNIGFPMYAKSVKRGLATDDTDGGTIGDVYLLPDVRHYYCGGGGRVIPAQVTNLDFLKVTSGWRESSKTFDTIPTRHIPGQGITPTNSGQLTVEEIILPFLLVWIMQQYDKKHNPTEYLFIPYTSNTYQFSDGRYKIKTDAENNNVANIIAQALIIIVTIVIAVVVCKSLVKLFKNKRYASLSGKVGVLDNAMWNGHKLTLKESRRYSRWKKKIGKLEGASAGMPGSGSFSESIIGYCKTMTQNIVDQTKPKASSDYKDELLPTLLSYYR